MDSISDLFVAPASVHVQYANSATDLFMDGARTNGGSGGTFTSRASYCRLPISDAAEFAPDPPFATA